MPKLLEREIERKLVAWCKKNGVLTYKFTSPSNRGVPDRILIYDDRVLFLELKQEGCKPTELQYAHLRKINKHGGHNTLAKWAAGYDQAVRRAVEFLGVVEQ